MKMFLSLIVLICAVALVVPIKNTHTAADSSKLDPQQFGFGEITPVEQSEGLEGLYPFPRETTYMVNHGMGWWYVPYTGDKLQAALTVFEEAHPKLHLQGSLQEVARQSRYSTPLPLDKYEYNPQKGTFVLFASN